MTRRASWWLVGLSLAPAAVMTAFACSSSQSASASAPIARCVQSGLDRPGYGKCSECVAAACGPMVSDFQTGCAAYLACVCPSGTTVDPARQLACAGMLADAGCAQAIVPLEACERSACGAACGVASLDGGTTLAEASNDAGALFSCSSSSAVTAECDEHVVSAASLAAATQGCLQVGGTPGTGCSDAGVVGCCLMSTTENCYYGDAAAPGRQDACSSLGGTWAASP